MLVQFQSVITDVLEAFEKQRDRDIKGEASIEFYNENEYLSKIVININDVLSFKSEYIYFNDKAVESVFVRLVDSNREWSGNLFISFKEFKDIYEICNNIKIYEATETNNIDNIIKHTDNRIKRHSLSDKEI